MATSLVLVNTQRAQQTALNAFDAFLVSDGTSRPDIDSRIAGDDSGRALFLVLDSFALYLACRSGIGPKTFKEHRTLILWEHKEPLLGQLQHAARKL